MTFRRRAAQFRSPITVLSLAGANFFLTIAFSLALDPNDFGICAAFWLALTLITSAVRAIFGEQLLAHPSTEDQIGLTSLAGLNTVLFVAAISVTVLAIGRLDLVLAVLSFGLLAGSDPIRYVRIAQADNLSPFVLPGLDLLRGGISLLAWVAALAGVGAWAIGAIAMVVGGLGFVTSWRGATLRRAIRYVKSRGAFEVALSAQFALSTAIGQLLPMLALGAFGPALFGQIRLAQTYVSPAMTAASAFQPMMIQAIAKNASRGPHPRTSLVRPIALLLAVGTGTLAAVLVATFLWLEPNDQPDIIAALIVPACVASLAAIVGQPGGAIIRVRKLGWISLNGQIIGAVVGLFACVVALDAGVIAFAWALASYSVATVVATYFLLVVSVLKSRARRNTDEN